MRGKSPSSSVASGLYHAISPSEIRLLHLNPQPEASEVGTLRVTDLSKAPPYYALSHCWGSRREDVILQMGGYPVALSSDLAAGVRRLQQLNFDNRDDDPAIRHLWVDTFCINMQDVKERSSQVAMMDQIYKGSVRTLIWLGPDKACSRLAWKLTDQIYDIFRASHPTAETPRDIPLGMYTESSHTSLGLPPLEHPLWLHLEHLMENEWFTRLWVVQEVVLSHLDPILLLGDSQYPWHRLAWVATWLRRSGYSRLKQIPESLRNVDTIANLRRAQQPWPLDALMSVTQVKFRCSDQRDKIYGLLGLAAGNQEGSSFSDELKPDYGLDISSLYQKVALILLKRKCSLAILTRSKGVDGSTTRLQRRYNIDLPSWAPDWSDFKVHNEGISTSLSWVHYSDVSKPASFSFPAQYMASAGLPLALEDSTNSSILRVNGMLVDTLLMALPYVKDQSDNQDDDTVFALHILRSFSLATSLLTNGNMRSWIAEFIRSTTANQHRLRGQSWDQCLQAGLAYLHGRLSQNKAIASLCITRSENANFMTQLEELSAQGVPEHYASLARNFGFNRAFIITSAGRMGLGPSNTRPGDLIAVMPGSGVPYCVRKCDYHLSFVGESYIEGLMGGEAIEAHRQGLIKEQILSFE